MTTEERVSLLLIVAAIAAVFAGCVWLVASLTNASLQTRWGVTGLAFTVSYCVLILWASLCQISGACSDDEERRGGDMQ